MFLEFYFSMDLHLLWPRAQGANGPGEVMGSKNMRARKKKKAQYHIMMCLYNISDQDIESNCEPAPHMCL